MVFVVYRPPNTSEYLSPEFNDTLNDMSSTCLIENKETIILGDVNCDYLNRLNNKEFKDVLLGHGFKQVITMPTRITRESSTLIDIIATTHKQNLFKHIIYSSCISDHELTGAIRKINCFKCVPRKICTQNFAYFDITGYKEDLKNTSWYQVYNITNPNTAWNKFKQILVSIIDKHASLVEKQVRGRNCPWLTREIKRNMNDQDYYLRKVRRTGRETDWLTYRRLRNQCTRLIAT